MCGIVAVVRRRATREPVTVDSLVDEMSSVETALSAPDAATGPALAAVADRLEAVNTSLQGVPGLLTMLADPASTDHLRHLGERVDLALVEIEAQLDDPLTADGIPDAADTGTAETGTAGTDAAGTGTAGTDAADTTGDGHRGPAADLEETNAALIRCKDAIWAIRRDRFGAASAVEELVPGIESPDALGIVLSMHQALSSIDRMEVRGRDSAGVEVQLVGHGLDPSDPAVAELIAGRDNPSFTSGSVRFAGETLVIVYKAAAEIGELGDNTAAIRRSIKADPLLRMVLESAGVEAIVLAHTRWASIGIASEPNAHPQCSDEIGSGVGVVQDPSLPFVTTVANGDIDNHADLIVSDDLRIPADVTTDAKVIPTLFARQVADGLDPLEAFRETVSRLEGSTAIASAVTSQPDRIYVALRGSGQAAYIGFAEDTFIVASEPYGVVEDASTYLRMDGETPSNSDNPTGSRGQIVELSIAGAGTLEGVRRWSYDSSELPVTADEIHSAEVTTRDIDRGDFKHYLLKEITDSPSSFRKTLRGKLVEQGDRIGVVLGPDVMPDTVREGLRSGTIRRIQVIGQGTAAIAGQSLAHHLADFTTGSSLQVEAVLATELSGFRLRPDMSDTLVVAISQSGTTTDTNRTVDLVRARGANVIAIVNRRGSDLSDKADGVLYTSDGRDVEMSVASTKAFYAQVAAGLLLAQVIADEVPGGTPSSDPEQQVILHALLELPAKMEQTLSVRTQAAEAAAAFAPSRRYWAIAGNGVNQIAAREIRVKLSELCYKAIACDGTEDKKHIDLSSEPMILVCAAGLVGSTADDVAKEVAIFRSHKAAPIVIASDGDRAFASAMAVLSVPSTHERLAFILSTMAGHIFGYEAALAIDAQAMPLRVAKAAIDSAAAQIGGSPGGEGARTATAATAGSTTAGSVVTNGVDPTVLLDRVHDELVPCASSYMDGLRSGAYNGHLEASTASRLAGHFRYATGTSPLDSYQVEFGKVGSPGVVLEDLSLSLSAAIEELTRPVDAIKHQAKTVTVGISRSDESLLQVPLVTQVLEAGSPRDRLEYSTLRSLADLDPAVVEVTGFTRYGVDHGDDLERATLVVVDRGGISLGLSSRVDRDPRLRGTKALVARERELMVAKGRSDDRLVLIIPEIKDGTTTGLQLLHIAVIDHLPAATARSVMEGYRRRFQALRDAVTETEDVFRDDLLAEQSVQDLLTVPILDLADRWRS